MAAPVLNDTHPGGECLKECAGRMYTSQTACDIWFTFSDHGNNQEEEGHNLDVTLTGTDIETLKSDLSQLSITSDIKKGGGNNTKTADSSGSSDLGASPALQSTSSSFPFGSAFGAGPQMQKPTSSSCSFGGFSTPRPNLKPSGCFSLESSSTPQSSPNLSGFNFGGGLICGDSPATQSTSGISGLAARPRSRGFAEDETPKPLGSLGTFRAKQETRKFLQNSTNQPKNEIEFIGDTDRLGAHKFILMSRSPVFLTMQEERWQKDDHGDVKITDMERDAFQEFLRYLYTDTCDVTEDNVTQLMYAASKYMVPSFYKSEALLNYLDQNLSIDNVAEYLELSLKFGSSDIVEICLSFIIASASPFFISGEQNSLSKEALSLILDQSALHCYGEIDVFHACVAWAKEQCKKSNQEATEDNCRQYMTEIIPKIRLKMIEPKQCAQILAGSDILTPEEKADIFSSLLQFDGGKGHFLSKRFSTLDREYDVLHFTGWQGQHSNNAFTCDLNIIYFRVSTTILLVQVGLHESRFGIQHQGELSVCTAKGKRLCRVTVTKATDLKKMRPVKIERGKTYSLMYKVATSSVLNPATRHQQGSLFGQQYQGVGIFGPGQPSASGRSDKRRSCRQCGYTEQEQQGVTKPEVKFEYDDEMEKTSPYRSGKGIFTRLSYIELN